MKNFKLNFKGLYGYRQSLLSRSPQPRDNQEMSERRPREERTLLTPFPQRFARYAAILIMLLTLGVGQMWASRTFKSGEVIYFKDTWKANGNSGTWKVDGDGKGKLCAYFYGDGEDWVNCGTIITGSWNEANALYAFTVPGDNKTYTGVIFTRGTATDWTNTWNQTMNQTPDEGKDLFCVNNTTTKDDNKDKYNGTWYTFSQYAYIEGRFHVQTAPGSDTWTNTFSSGDWNESSTAIPMTWDATNKRFYLHTYATLKNLTDNISEQGPVFYIKTAHISADLTDGTGGYDASYQANTSTTFTSSNGLAGSKIQLHTSGDGRANSNLKFDYSSGTNGYVVLYFTPSDGKIWYDLEYQVNFGKGTGGNTVTATAGSSLNSGDCVLSGTSVTFDQTAQSGYTFSKWNSASDDTGTQLSTNASYTVSISESNTTSSAFSAYSQYTPNTYSVHFDKNATSATGEMSNQAFTYDAAATALTANAYVRDGYRFDYWTTNSDGSGTQYTDGQSVSNLTAVDGGTFNLYAHWTKSELANIALTPTDYAVQEEHPTITATPILSISSGIGTTSICWGLYTDAGCTTPVVGVSFSSNPSAGAGAVTFTAPDAAGTYYLKAIFRAGNTCEGTELNSVTRSFIVHPTHTVTVKAKVGEEFIPNDEYNQTSHTVTVNTHRATEVAVPVIPGYDFVDWTLGENMAKTDAELTANPIHITATAASTLTANYNYATYEVTYPEDARWIFSDNDASVTYNSTGHFTVTPAAGYSITVTASDENGSVTLYPDGNFYSFEQGTSPVTISVSPTEVTNTITVVNGTPAEVTAKVSSTTATVTANAAPTGKKFLTWYLGSGILLTSGDTTSRTITFHASQSTTITAAYTDRSKVTVHFAKPHDWSNVKAKFYQGETAKTDWVEAVSTSTYEGATYYTFSYYTDNTGEDGGDQSAQASWNKVEFSNNGSTPHTKLTITNGNYYAKGGDAAGRATPYAEWYLRGNLNGEPNWDDGDYYKYPFSIEGSTLVYAFGATSENEQYFRLYRTSTGQWFRTTSTSGNQVITIDATSTLLENSSSADFINTATEKGVYLFTLTNINSAAPSLTVTHPVDTKSSARVSAGANGTITSSTSSITELGRYMPTAIEANANAGYRFKEWVTTGGVVVKDPTNRSTTATATADGTLTATFTNEGIVYLDLSAITEWNNRTPTVYFFSSSYWDKDKGSGSKNILYGGERMTRIGTSNIWYYDYSGTSMGIDGTKNYIAFTDHEQDGYANFSSCSAIYRGDFYPAMNTFVPQNTITARLNNKTVAYYNNGYWMKYNEEESGYNLRIYDGQGKNLQEVIHFIGSRDSYTATLHVDGAASAKFELVGHDQGWKNGIYYDGTFYGNTGTINWTISDWNWEYTHGTGKAYINLNSNGDYVFTLNCKGDGKLYVKVAYPISDGDFRIKYNGLVTTVDDSKDNMYSDAIPHLTENGTRKDTVSFFVTNQSGKEAALSLEKVSSINSSTGEITWGSASETFSGSAISSLEAGVYMFEIVQTKSGETTSFTYTNLGKYDGKYYVRTDCANGGWVAYKQNEDNLMRETNYASAGYNRYFCRYVPSGSVKFCVANEYNSQLSKQINSDAINTAGDGSISVSANTRFEYDNTTNKVSRSYIGSSADATFLYILDAAPVKIYKADEDPLTDNKGKFNDDENWIYSLEVQATPGATYQLKAEINGHTQFFDGTESAKTLLGGSGDKQKMRLVYDFKNNHLLRAWLPNGVVSGTYEINADVMLIREGQAAATQLQFGDGAKLLDVHNVYGVLGFEKDFMTNKSETRSSSERSLYWISFPFEVKLKDIFGFGKYGEDFIVRRYNGAKRAEKGWFLGDGTTTFWETMSPDSVKDADNTMKAYEGYMVALDRGLFNSSDTRWYADEKEIDELYLYFPSASVTIGELSKKDTIVTLDSMNCTINRTFTQDAALSENERRNHKNTDSNWRVIGVGSLCTSQITATNLDNEATSFDYYEWNSGTNTLTPATCKQYLAGDATNFLAGHAYMVQWAGKITWKSASVPASVAARRSPEKKNYEVELDLNKNDIMQDRTYVVLQENASPEYVLNEDLYKATNSNYPNIYAFAGSYDCGVSRIPIESTTVPVGVIIRKNGTYTFSMPSNFDGTVTLIDTYSQTRTNLGLEDYEVYLNKGTMDDRFLLEININNAPTAIDGVEGGSLKDGKAHKFIENGVMYILKDGKLYDARGAMVK